MQTEEESMSYNKGQTWYALKKAWRAYKIAKSKNDKEKIKKYQETIRALQLELGLEQTEFKEDLP